MSELTPPSSLHLQAVPPVAATAVQQWCATGRTSVPPRSPSSPSRSTTSSPPSRHSPSPSPHFCCQLPQGCRPAAAPPPAPAQVEVRLRRMAVKTTAGTTRRPLLLQSDPPLLEATPQCACRVVPAPLPVPPARPALRRRRTATPARCRPRPPASRGGARPLPRRPWELRGVWCRQCCPPCRATASTGGRWPACLHCRGTRSARWEAGTLEVMWRETAELQSEHIMVGDFRITCVILCVLE